MKKLLAIALFLSVSVNAYAVDGGAVVGGAVGGAAGAAIGHNMGGKEGAILGAAIGGATGAAVGSSNSTQPAPAKTTVVRTAEARDVEEGGDRHDNGRHLGERKNKHKKKHKHDED